MSFEPEILIRGEDVVLRQGTVALARTPVEALMEASHGMTTCESDFAVRPAGVRIWAERGAAVATAVEIPPHSRQVQWLADDSPEPFGPDAKYETYHVSFPYIVILLVFRDGALTGQQQLYYRTEPLEMGDELLIPNLYNVAKGYGQRCWLCLQKLSDLSELPWNEKIAVVVDHVFSAAFNRSAEVHEGNSYWRTGGDLDPRVANMEAWQAATQADRRMALDIAWRPADSTAAAELDRMLGEVVRPRPLRSATDLAGVVVATAKSKEVS